MTITVPPRPSVNFSAIPVIYSEFPPEESYGIANAAFILGAHGDAIALTDRGTAIPLFRYQTLITPAPQWNRPIHQDHDLTGIMQMLEMRFLERAKKPQSHLQRVRDPDPGCNCHGWTFAAGLYGVHLESIPRILNDQSYQEVDSPRTGDIVIYRAHDGITHSGFVRTSVGEQDITVESKWGPFGVFLHNADAHPGICTYYRSTRVGHSLKIERLAGSKSRCQSFSLRQSSGDKLVS